MCTRRAAKSYSDGLVLAKAALERPDVSCLYIGLTRESAKRIMWKDVLKAINRRHKLGTIEGAHSGALPSARQNCASTIGGWQTAGRTAPRR